MYPDIGVLFMRIDERTGEMLSTENDYCPYCDNFLDDPNYDYCEKCGEYVGIVVRNYPNYGSMEYNNVNSNSDNQNNGGGHEKTCCGICFLLFLIFWLFSIITYNPI